MNTYNHLANRRHDAAYQVTTDSGDGNLRTLGRLLGILRLYTNMVIGDPRAWLGPRNGLEADTRQIRNFGRSETPGACEVRLGLRLAT